jgi:hypothetical protein
MREMDRVLPGKAVGGLVGELVGRCVAVGGKDAGLASVGMTLGGEACEAVAAKVGNVTGPVGYGVDDGSVDGVNVANIRSRLDGGSGDGVIVGALTGQQFPLWD